MAQAGVPWSLTNLDVLKIADVDAAPIAPRGQSALARATKLEKQGVLPAPLGTQHVRTHLSKVLLVIGYDLVLR